MKARLISKTIVLLALIGMFVLLFGGYLLDWGWTGFKGKTFWDFLGVLAVPIVVGLGAAWYSAQQGRVIDKENKDNQRQSALQAYIDKMSELLLDKYNPLRKSKPDDEVRKIARAHTVTALRGLDATRKASVLQFLYESSLLTKDSPIIDLQEANLSEANLSDAKLSSVNLSGADLSEADLSYANLSSANLTKADLSEADLRGADLRGADLRGANLTKADLSEADLRGANLRGANLHNTNRIEQPTFPAIVWSILWSAPRGSVEMKGADMSGADLSGADLSGADLSGADLSGVSTVDDFSRPLDQRYAANLSGADLSGANLSGADLSGANLSGAVITEEQLKEAKSLPGTDQKRERFDLQAGG